VLFEDDGVCAIFKGLKIYVKGGEKEENNPGVGVRREGSAGGLAL